MHKTWRDAWKHIFSRVHAVTFRQADAPEMYNATDVKMKSQ